MWLHAPGVVVDVHKGVKGHEARILAIRWVGRGFKQEVVDGGLFYAWRMQAHVAPTDAGLGKCCKRATLEPASKREGSQK